MRIFQKVESRLVVLGWCIDGECVFSAKVFATGRCSSRRPTVDHQAMDFVNVCVLSLCSLMYQKHDVMHM